MDFGLLDRDSPATPGVIAPKVTLSFGGDTGGGPGGLVPAIGPFAAGPGPEQGLLSLTVTRGFAPSVDWAELLLTPVPGGADLPALGDIASITLTAGDHSSTFAGSVDSVEHRPDGSARLGIGNGGRILAQARSSTAFADLSPGRIIDTLCSEHGVDSSAGNTGDLIPRYMADAGRSVLDHITLLAASAGMLARFDDENSLELIDDTAAGEEIPLTASDAILDFRLTERAGSGGIRITGAGAGEWAWLRKDPGPLQAETGSPPPLRRTSTPWLRGTGGIESFAEARGRALSRGAGPGRLLLAAWPDAVPGTIVALTGTPLDGPWRVLSSTQRLDPQTGFSNDLAVARADGGAGALGLGGLP